MVGADAVLTLVVIVAVLGTMVFTRLSPDVTLLGGVVVLLLSGVIDTTDALSGLSNPGVATVGALYVVAAGLRETGAVGRLVARLLGPRRGVRGALARIVLPVIGLSAFMNNTPIVAAMIPALRDWARSAQVSPSRLLLPLSYAAILGGTCTLIGTSTNLVVAGLVHDALGSHAGLVAPGLFDVGRVGLPVALAGAATLVLFAPLLLPARAAAIGSPHNPREYTVEIEVSHNSPVVGKSIEEAGLRHLPGAFVIELVRDGHVLPAVSPTERLQPKDRLILAGVLESVVDLQRIPGLVAAPDQVYEMEGGNRDRQLVEAVVSPINPLLGMTIRGARFRETFGGVVVAVARHGHRVGGKLGDIRLQAGDVLLIETSPGFVNRFRNRREFYLVSPVPDSSRLRHDKAPLAVAIVIAMVVAAATGLVSMLAAALLASAAMLATKCLGAREGRQAIDWPVILAIAAAIGLGRAMQASGLDQALASAVVWVGGESPWLSLALLYLATSMVTEVVTNNAAAVLAFPLGLGVADQLAVSPMPFVFTVMMAASAAFLTPIGYQTNLMVYGPGGYRFTDYLRAGVPVSIVVFVVTVGLAPVFWPFA